MGLLNDTISTAIKFKGNMDSKKKHDRELS